MTTPGRVSWPTALFALALFIPIQPAAASVVVGWGANVDYFGNTQNQAKPPPGLSVSAVAAGGFHSLALLPNGTVIGWGSNLDFDNNPAGQASPPSDLTDASSIAAGGFHSVALRRNGTVVAWGAGGNSQTGVPHGLEAVRQIAAGAYFSMALRSNGTVIGWGDTPFQPGGTEMSADWSNVVAIAAGGRHSLGLRRNGTVVGWGNNQDINFEPSNQSIPPAGLSGVAAIAAGFYHSLALKSNGTVVAWGSNQSGERNVPVGLSNVVAISAGLSFSVALRADGTLVVWGDDTLAQRSGARTEGGATSIAAGGYHVLALKRDGVSPFIIRQPLSLSRRTGTVANLRVVAGLTTDYQWRRNGFNLPNQTNAHLTIYGVRSTDAGDYSVVCRNTFGSVTSSIASLKMDEPMSGRVLAWTAEPWPSTEVPPALENVVDVAAWNVSVALKADGTVAGWGVDEFEMFPALPGLTGVREIVTSPFTTVVLKNNGQVQGWGLEHLLPPPITDAVAITAGTTHYLALLRDGTVRGWGEEPGAAVPDGLANVIAIAAGDNHSLALRADGSLVGWGFNDYGQSVAPEDLDDVVAISAFDRHSLALRGDGTVRAFGNNHWNVSTPPESLHGVTKIATGNAHALALLADSTVVSWGEVPAGPESLPPGLTGVTAIAAGADFSLAVTVAPIVTVTPDRTPAVPGDTATFTATALNNGPFTYQWLFNGVEIPGATASTLTLASVQLNQAGYYSVRVSNRYGAAVSRESVLSLPPRMNFALENGVLRLTWPRWASDFILESADGGSSSWEFAPADFYFDDSENLFVSDFFVPEGTSYFRLRRE